MTNEGQLGRKLAMYQAATQMVVRALMYAAVLLVLPSFISITSSAAYADIVMLSTLAAVSTQLDGGHATSLLTLLTSPQMRDDPYLIRAAAKTALMGTLKWAACCSLIFCLGVLGSGREPGSENFGWMLLCGIAISSACAVSNTAAKIIFVKNFSLQSSVFLITGPLLTLGLLLTLRIQHLTGLLAITFSFLAGYTINIFSSAWIIRLRGQKKALSKYLVDVEMPKVESRYWILLTQIVSILIVVKNPILIKVISGDVALSTLSIYMACYTLMLAPVAAMQIPMIIGFKKLSQCNPVVLFPAFLIHRLSQAVAMTAFVGFIIFIAVWTNPFNLYSTISSHVSIWGLLGAASSAVIASISIVIALYLTAIGRLRFLAFSAIFVLTVDITVILTFTSTAGGLSPLLSIMAANVLSVFVFMFFARSLRQN